MGRPRFAKIRDIRDGNHAPIVEYLRKHGIEVVETERPVDILIFNGKQAGWAEIKVDSRNAQIKRSQLEFISETNMPVAIVRNEAEALEFAKTMQGITETQKHFIALFLAKNPSVASIYPAGLERILNV
jgi:hypothetical protein